MMGEETREDRKIRFADDVLREFLGWIPRENILGVSLVNLRFWLFCDESLDSRKYRIDTLVIKKTSIREPGYDPVNPETVEAHRWIVNRNTYVRRSVQLAEVEPPMKFTFEGISISCGISPKIMNFLQVSKRLFIGVFLEFKWENFGWDNLDKISDAFDRCNFIRIRNATSSLTPDFLAKASILNCRRLEILVQDLNARNNFDGLHIFEWLHTTPIPASLGSNGGQSALRLHRQVCLNQPLDTLSGLIDNIHHRFSTDVDAKPKFIVRIRLPRPDFDMTGGYRLENRVTGEVLLMRKTIMPFTFTTFWDLIRCSKEEESIMVYEDPQIRPFVSLH